MEKEKKGEAGGNQSEGVENLTARLAAYGAHDHPHGKRRHDGIPGEECERITIGALQERRAVDHVVQDAQADAIRMTVTIAVRPARLAHQPDTEPNPRDGSHEGC